VWFGQSMIMIDAHGMGEPLGRSLLGRSLKDRLLRRIDLPCTDFVSTQNTTHIADLDAFIVKVPGQLQS
jgi:hypothetical protein